jgi:hypothetical protein
VSLDERGLQESLARVQATDRNIQRADIPKADIGGRLTGGRQSARGMIEDRLSRAEKEVAGLRALLNALPMQLTPDADEALWSLVWGRP